METLSEEKMSVTFETKCYEKDWEFIIKKNLIEKMISNCNYKFDKRILFLNNFSDYQNVKIEADKLVSKNILDAYYVVEDHAVEALAFFNLKKEDFLGGYYYSIAEIVSLYLCNTTYNLHFSGDACMEANCTDDWIDAAIKVMNEDETILVANPTWDRKYEEAKAESFFEDQDWYYAIGGFSDQSYLVRSADFKKDIYKYTHPLSERYPKYGGELFEKRIDAYMRCADLKRITSKHCSYIHQNFPKTGLEKIKRFIKDNVLRRQMP